MLQYLLYLLLVNLALSDKQKPNFVIFLTDDQDVTLGGMKPMRNVERLIANEGITFTNSFVTSPICCPSRASFLTGRYVHNHQTTNNSVDGGCYGPAWRLQEGNTFATELEGDGYNTFYAGKYLNQYGFAAVGGPEQVPPGWSDWYGLVGNSVYYNYTISNNGVPTFSSNEYLTDVIRDLGIGFLENQNLSKPFLMVVAPPAPHAPFTPAPRHRGTYRNTTALRTPNFNAGYENKHWLIRMAPTPLPEDMMSELDRAYTARWETLMAVDEMVADIVGSLRNNSLLDNTYVIYTSDNGYHIGQFAQVYDKRQPYEHDIRVPLVIRGPGIDKNLKTNQPVLNIDLAPTILELAGLKVPSRMDGKPISFERTDGTVERNMLVEYHGEGDSGRVDASCPWKFDTNEVTECYPQSACKCQDSRNNTYACLRRISVRTDIKYCIFADDEHFEEFYNIAEDPFEIENTVDTVLPALKHWYLLILSGLLACEGPNCNISPESLTVEN